MYNYGLIGNCHISALISRQGSLDWLCLPRPDSPPVFGRMLDPDGGQFSIEPDGDYTSEQNYLRHSNILVTHFKCKQGGEFKITDFCPRFMQFGRMFRPISLFRIIEPITGECRIRVKCEPVQGWRKTKSQPSPGNAHLKWEMNDDYLRLNTNMSVTHLLDQSAFTLNKKIYFALTWSTSLEKDLPRVSEDYLNETEKYWDLWVKHCSIPSMYQQETIRSALALKLHCFEDTGAILAALTTSLPEEIGGVRNWDYRYCWLRDAYFVLSALYGLGQFEEMEDFLRFLLNIVADNDLTTNGLGPVYGLDHQKPGLEIAHENWRGYGNSRPVRASNQASEHIQNDVYGEMVLSLAPIFFDARFTHLRSKEYENLLGKLLAQCSRRISQRDAGPWEIRTEWREHSFSNLACWAGLDRGSKLQKMGFLKNLDFDMEASLLQAHQSLKAAVFEGSLRNGPKDETVDASLLMLSIFRYPDPQLCAQTVVHIADALQIPHTPTGFLYRYKRKDDFGLPKSAFLICGFWLVQALAKINRKPEGVEVLNHLLKSANHLGLYSEHYEAEPRLQSGNFPQAYSHVGLINAAFAVSPNWSEIL